MLGSPGVGKSTLINTLLNAPIVPTDRIRGSDGFQLASYYGYCVDNGIQLDVEIGEVLGFTSAAKLLDHEFTAKLLNSVKIRHQALYQSQDSTFKHLPTFFGNLFHAVLYFVPPTFRQFSNAEIALFGELQKLALLIPIISKADMYTSEELRRQKLLIRAQFEANSLVMIPDLLNGFTDIHLMEDFSRLIQRWPFAAIGGLQIHDDGGNSIMRVRTYPWAIIDIDHEEQNDLHDIETLLISSFKILNEHFIRANLYEHIWRPSFITQPKATMLQDGPPPEIHFRFMKNRRLGKSGSNGVEQTGLCSGSGEAESFNESTRCDPAPYYEIDQPNHEIHATMMSSKAVLDSSAETSISQYRDDTRDSNFAAAPFDPHGQPIDTVQAAKISEPQSLLHS